MGEKQIIDDMPTTTVISSADEVIKMKLINIIKRHNKLEMKYKEIRTAHSQVHCASCKKRNETMKILLANKENTTAQIAHLVFANTQTNSKKQKELFFCYRYKINRIFER